MSWCIILSFLFMYSVYLGLGITTIILMYTTETPAEFKIIFLVLFTSFFNLFCGCAIYYRIRTRQEDALARASPTEIIIDIPMNTVQGTIVLQPDGKIDIGT